jgi:hypothetical protein
MNITFKEALEKARTFSYQNKDLENKNDDTNHPNKKSRIEVIYDNNKLPERYIDEMPAYYGMKTSNKFEKKVFNQLEVDAGIQTIFLTELAIKNNKRCCPLGHKCAKSLKNLIKFNDINIVSANISDNTYYLDVLYHPEANNPVNVCTRPHILSDNTIENFSNIVEFYSRKYKTSM